jgi:hypothetical protein
MRRVLRWAWNGMTAAGRHSWPACVALSACAVPPAGCSADRLVLAPSTQPVRSRGTEVLAERPRGGTLQLFARRSNGCDGGREPAAMVLVFGGNGDRAEWAVDTVVDEWGDLPVEVVAANYPGYGRSTGPAALSGVAAAAADAYDVVAARADGRPVFVQANSLGTAAALRVAAVRPVAGLVLQNPPPLRQLFHWWFGPLNLWLVTWPAAGQIPDDLDSLGNAARCRCPAVFLIAGGDLLVPPCFQRLAVRAYAGDRRVVDLPWAPHNARVAGAQMADLQTALGGLWSHAGLVGRAPSRTE